MVVRLLSAMIICLLVGGQMPYGWVDVRSGSNDCPAATGELETIDTQAFQCQIDWLTRIGGGFLLIGPGNYNISGGITLSGAVTLQGAGQNASFLWGMIDHYTIRLDETCSFCGFRDLTVYGYMQPTHNSNAVVVAFNRPAILQHNTIWGGSAALYTQGIDGFISDCYMTGFTSGVVSTGANWYVRDKIDGPLGQSTAGTTAFYQGDTPSGQSSAENHFTQTDFSGWQWSMQIQDNNHRAITVVESSVLANNIVIGGALTTFFQGNEFGGSISGPHTCGVNVFGSC